MPDFSVYYRDARRVDKVLARLGAHRRFGHSGHAQYVLAGRTISVPHHGRELAKGTARAIVRSVVACGVSKSTYENLLLAA